MIPCIMGAFLLFLCWGSFLNVIGYRIIRGYPLTGRSFCPHCRTTIAWYDLIPFVSWMVLKGRCRNCKNRISILYPFIEVATASLLSLMVLFIDQQYWLGYGLFISALLVTIRTDFEKMLISRFMTWGLMPIAFLLSLINLLPLNPLESFAGGLFGYTLLWLIARVFFYVRNIEGLGEGDFDLLAMIGSFTGITGAWVSLFLGSFFGVMAVLLQVVFGNRTLRKIAFGPWLAAGALVYVFFSEQIILFLYPVNL